mmetsp:Transcript_36737/g.88302  ORF Transcript_36737/g.88302 Transcript_36737/m.88302 type:complete len:477 (-) Transcript_36737:884-2314(-)
MYRCLLTSHYRAAVAFGRCFPGLTEKLLAISWIQRVAADDALTVRVLIPDEPVALSSSGNSDRLPVPLGVVQRRVEAEPVVIQGAGIVALTVLQPADGRAGDLATVFVEHAALGKLHQRSSLNLAEHLGCDNGVPLYRLDVADHDPALRRIDLPGAVPDSLPLIFVPHRGLPGVASLEEIKRHPRQRAVRRAPLRLDPRAGRQHFHGHCGIHPEDGLGDSRNSTVIDDGVDHVLRSVYPDPETDCGLAARHPVRGGHENVLVNVPLLPLHHVQLHGRVGVALGVPVVVPRSEALLPPQVGLGETAGHFAGSIIDCDEEIRGSRRIQRLGPALLLGVVGPEVLAPPGVALGLPRGDDRVLVARGGHTVDEEARGVGVQEPALNDRVEVLMEIFHHHPHCTVPHLLRIAVDQIVRYTILQTTVFRSRASVQQLHVTLTLELDHPVNDVGVGSPQIDPPHLAALHVRARNPHAFALHLH